MQTIYFQTLKKNMDNTCGRIQGLEWMVSIVFGLFNINLKNSLSIWPNWYLKWVNIEQGSPPQSFKHLQ